MYFFKFQMKDVIKLHAWEDKSKKCVLYVNPHNGFYLLTVNGSNIHRQIYPLRSEVLSVTHTSQDACPYISFRHNMNLNVYYVDMRENVTIWTQLVFLENLGLFTEAIIHNSDLLKQQTYINYEIARGICTKNKVSSFSIHYHFSICPNCPVQSCIAQIISSFLPFCVHLVCNLYDIKIVLVQNHCTLVGKPV